MTNLEHDHHATPESEPDISADVEAAEPPVEIRVIPNEVVLHALAATSPNELHKIEAARRLRAK